MKVIAIHKKCIERKKCTQYDMHIYLKINKYFCKKNKQFLLSKTKILRKYIYSLQEILNI